jgi:chromosome segregation ATPase
MRMLNWFKRLGRSGGPPGADPADPSSFSLMRWGAGRQQTVEKLQAGYERLLNLCQTIDDHLQSQRHQGQQAADSLTQLTSSIQEVPSLLGQLSQRLDRIADQALKAASSTDRLSDAIDQLIPAQKSQNDLLSCVHRQLAESSQTNAQLAEVVVELKGAMNVLARSEQDRSRVFEGLAQLIQQRDNDFSHMLGEHTRTFKWAWASSLSAAIVAVAIALVVLVRQAH